MNAYSVMPDRSRHLSAGGPAGRLALSGRLVACLAGRPLTGVSAELCRAGAVVRPAGELAAARRAAELLGPRALVVLDLPGGPEAAAPSLLPFRRQDALLVLLPAASSGQRVLLLQRGADHVLPDGHPDEVVASLAAVLRRCGQRPAGVGTQVLHVGELCADLTSRTATAAGRRLRLTVLEFDLLAYFLANPGRPLSREHLLAQVWGFEIGGLDTVTVHVRRLRQKIEAEPSRPRLLQTVWGIGYRLDAGRDGIDRTPAVSVDMSAVSGG